MNKAAFERSTWNDIRIHVLPTDRFKTFAISLYVGLPLAEETVTPVALTPFVLRRGTESYPETIQFRERLDDLYGAGFGFDIYKRGDYQIVQFRMDIINDKFVQSNESLLKQSFAFLGDALTKPVLENGRFRQKYVASEKETLKKKLESIVNDKIKYAAERCIEEMCKNEPYRLHPLGKINDLEAIDAETLYDTYQNWIRSAPIDLYVVGATTLEEVMSLVESSFAFRRSGVSGYSQKSTHPQVSEVNTVIDRMDVSQGKLNMGLRTSATYATPSYPAALMYNGILGGYPHSKMFINVREKASLAYYAASRLDGHKGILTIQSGIEIGNYEKAVNIIREQLEAMKAGEISELEMSQTRAMIGNQLREIGDSAFEMIGYDFNSVLSGKTRTTAELISAVEAVTVDEIKAIADGVQLNTIYFLRDRKGE